MAKKRVSSVQSVRILSADGKVTTVFKAKTKRKKQSMGVRTAGDAQLRAVQTAIKASKAYVVRHKRSNKRQKDGWLVDLATNVLKSAPDVIKEARKQAID